ncbi:MAG: VCBS repeat-containing protein [Pirellulales bacterium]|nr:VCBS repeat-containing protein [Pirellulales bacterium]
MSDPQLMMYNPRENKSADRNHTSKPGTSGVFFFPPVMGAFFALIVLTPTATTPADDVEKPLPEIASLATLAPGWQGQIAARIPQSYCGWGLAIGDADNDGRNEILATGCPDSRLYLLRKQSDAWQTRLLADKLADGVPGMGLCVKILDLNGDGRNEIILGTGQELHPIPAFFHVMHTDGWQITSKVSARPWNPKSRFTHNFGCHDLDGDGVKEVIAAYCSSGEIVRYDATADLGTVSARTIYVNPGSGEDSWIADVDNDGRVEYIDANGYRHGQADIRVFEFNDDGSLAAQPRIVIAGYDGKPCFLGTVAVGDVDNDGQNELIVGWSRKHGDKMGTIIGYKLDGAEARLTYTIAREDPEMGVGYFGQLMQIADVDNDGRNELVVATRAEPLSGSTDPMSPLPGSAYMFRVGADGSIKRTMLARFDKDAAQSCWPVVGDADNDGLNELVLATGQGDRSRPGTSYVIMVEVSQPSKPACCLRSRSFRCRPEPGVIQKRKLRE